MRQSIHVRLPESLVQVLRERADQEQVSVNTLVVSIIAGALGYPPKKGKS
jgi:predicted HicB family RNase H-like nuclease